MKQSNETWENTCKNFTFETETLQGYDLAMERKTDDYKIWVDKNILPTIIESIQTDKEFKLSTPLGYGSYMEYIIKVDRNGVGNVQQYNTEYKNPLLSDRVLNGWSDLFNCLAHGVSSNKKWQTEIAII